MARTPVAPLVGPDMMVMRVRVRAPDVVFVKGVLDAHEGLCQVFAEEGGDLTIAGPHERAAEIERVVSELVAEVGGVVTMGPARAP